MIFVKRRYRIFFYNQFVDMRKGHSSLSMLIVREMNFELMEGDLFFFISKNRKITKGLFFDGTGLVLLHKKLESGRFMSFASAQSAFEVSKDEFRMVFHGGHLPLSRSGKRIKFKK